MEGIVEGVAKGGYYLRNRSGKPPKGTAKACSGRGVKKKCAPKRKLSLSSVTSNATSSSSTTSLGSRRKVKTVKVSAHKAKKTGFVPFERSPAVGLHPFPIMDVPSSKLTLVTASMQFLMSVISDKDLNTLRQKQPPPEHSNLWCELRDALCDCQMALRNREKKNALPLAVTGRLMLALYRYGKMAGNKDIQALFSSNVTVSSSIQPENFITENLDCFQLQSPLAFICCLASVLTDDPQTEWGYDTLDAGESDDSEFVGIQVPLDKPLKDAVFTHMPIFLSEQDKSAIKIVNRCTVPLAPGAEPVEVVFDADGRRYQELVLGAEHAAAFQIAQEFYRIAEFKTADVVCHGIDADGYRHLLVSLPQAHELKVSFCYDKATVRARMAEGARHRAAIVFDAWLKNDAVQEGLLSTVNLPSPQMGVLRHYAYRLGFNCMGFRNVVGQVERRKRERYEVQPLSDFFILACLPAFAGLKTEELMWGMERLSKLRDETICEIVARYWSGSGDSAMEIANLLIERKNNLINMAGISLEEDNVIEPLPPVFHDKRHAAAVKAVCGSHGQIHFPNLFLNGEPVKASGALRTLLCHKGDAREDGTYITLHRINDAWCIVDDMNNEREGAISIDEYLYPKQLEHLVDDDNPAGTQTLENLLMCGFLRITPELVMWELDSGTKRSEWTPEFENAVLRNWQKTCNQMDEEGQASDSDADYVDCEETISVESVEPSEGNPELPSSVASVIPKVIPTVIPARPSHVMVIQDGEWVAVPPKKMLP